MSIRADLAGTFRRAKKVYSLSEQECAMLYWEVITDLGWDFDEMGGADCDLIKEIKCARVELFGELT